MYDRISQRINERTERRRLRRGSLFFPILIIAVGVIFLLNNIGVISGNIWDNIFQFWPVILIAIGLDSIYRGEGAAGAAFMIGVGVIFLLSNLGYLAVDIWQIIIRIWPILLIAIGFDIIIGRRSWIAALLGVIAVLGILAGAVWLFGGPINQGQPITGEAISQPLQGAASAQVNLEAGAASLFLNKQSKPEGLITGTIAPGPGQKLSQNYSMTGNQAEYTLSSSGSAIGHIPGGSNQYNWKLALNPQVPVDLKLSMGAGEANLDLTGLNISKLRSDLAVGDTKITLPQNGRLDAAVDSAIGSVTIYVPKGTALQIKAANGLSTISVPPGYQKEGKTYTSPGYTSAENRVNLDLNQAIGSMTIIEQ